MLSRDSESQSRRAAEPQSELGQDRKGVWGLAEELVRGTRRQRSTAYRSDKRRCLNFAELGEVVLKLKLVATTVEVSCQATTTRPS